MKRNLGLLAALASMASFGTYSPQPAAPNMPPLKPREAGVNRPPPVGHMRMGKFRKRKETWSLVASHTDGTAVFRRKQSPRIYRTFKYSVKP